jgi:tripartite-type tricarboxylate transporter receptor subunit TctC
MKRFTIAICSAFCLLTALPTLAADPIADFYKGKTLYIMCGSEAGGPYDLYARQMARHLPRHLPGNPNVIVQNMVGGGSLQAANHVLSIAPQDGTVIAAISSNLPFSSLVDTNAPKFDPLRGHWLPGPASDTATVTVWHTVPLNTFLDARNRETVMGASSPTSNPAFYGRLLVDIFKVKFKIVTGYPSSPSLFQAMERGEADGHPSATWVSLKTTYAQLLRDKKVKQLLHYGLAPNPELAGVPFAKDLAEKEEDKLLLDMAVGSTVLGRPYFMGPGVPPDRLAAMRKAFLDTYRDPQYLAEAEKLKLDVDPVSSEETEAIIKRSYGAPQGLIERLQRLFKPT